MNAPAYRNDPDIGRYRKIYPRLWRSVPFVSLTAAERLIVLYVLGGPQRNRHFSLAMAADDLGTSPHTFQERFAKVCETFGWHFVPTADARGRLMIRHRRGIEA
jgi:hypothetical protein